MAEKVADLRSAMLGVDVLQAHRAAQACTGKQVPFKDVGPGGPVLRRLQMRLRRFGRRQGDRSRKIMAQMFLFCPTNAASAAACSTATGTIAMPEQVCNWLMRMVFISL